MTAGAERHARGSRIRLTGRADGSRLSRWFRLLLEDGAPPRLLRTGLFLPRRFFSATFFAAFLSGFFSAAFFAAFFAGLLRQPSSTAFFAAAFLAAFFAAAFLTGLLRGGLLDRLLRGGLLHRFLGCLLGRHLLRTLWRSLLHRLLLGRRGRAPRAGPRLEARPAAGGCGWRLWCLYRDCHLRFHFQFLVVFIVRPIYAKLGLQIDVLFIVGVLVLVVKSQAP